MATHTSKTASTRKNRKSTRVVLTAENENLRRHLQGYQAIGAMGDRLARGESFAYIVNEAARDCARTFEADLVCILVLSEDGDQLQVEASIGLDSTRVEPVPADPHQTPLQMARQAVPRWAEQPAGRGASRSSEEDALFVPMEFQRVPVGVLCVRRGPAAPRFDRVESELLHAFASQLAIAAFMRGPARLMMHRERIEHEMHFAHALKARLMPRSAPECPGLRIDVRHLRSLDGGGDFYDFIPLEGDRLAVVIGECSGRGAKAALHLAHIIPAIRGSLAAGAGPSEALVDLNDGLVRQGQRGQLVSLCFAELDPGAGRMRLAQVGSTATHLLEGDEVRSLAATSGTPLGVLADCDVPLGCHALSPGAGWVFTTDGLNKSHDDRGVAFSGERLRKMLSQIRPKADAGASLAGALAEHIAEDAQPDILTDDVTILSLECRA